MKKEKFSMRLCAFATAALLLVSGAAKLAPISANAASSSEIRNQINALKEEKEEIKEKIADVQVQYQENEDEIADIISRKNVIDQELQLLYDQVENISQFSQWQENSDFFRSCRILPPENEQKKNA